MQLSFFFCFLLNDTVLAGWQKTLVSAWPVPLMRTSPSVGGFSVPGITWSETPRLPRAKGLPSSTTSGSDTSHTRLTLCLTRCYCHRTPVNVSHEQCCSSAVLHQQLWTGSYCGGARKEERNQLVRLSTMTAFYVLPWERDKPFNIVYWGHKTSHCNQGLVWTCWFLGNTHNRHKLHLH